MSEEEKQTIEYLKARLYGNEGCKIIDVAQSDLRIFLKLVENLQKDIESWKKYCNEQENDITLKNNKICDLEFKIEKQSKEIEELEEENFNLKEKQIIDKCEVPTQDNFYGYFAQNYLQIPISFLTEENLDWLEQHCEKTIRYATRNVLKEHQITLELIVKYKEMSKEIRDLKENKEDYIPKSKVKEKIEELDKEMAKDEVDEFGIHSQGWAALDWTRDFLLKLLEEGE